MARKQGRSDSGSGSVALGDIVTHARGPRTKREIAEMAGLHPTTIGKIESGDRGMSLETFLRLHSVLDHPDDFLQAVYDHYANGQS